MAVSTGFVSPGSAANYDYSGTVAWTSPSNALTSNDSRASCNVGASASSDYLALYNFGFSIPSTAVIKQVNIRVEGYTSSTAEQMGVVCYYCDNATTGVTSTAQDLGWLPTSEGTSTYAHSGAQLTPAQVNSSNWGLRVLATNYVGSAKYAYIDAISVEIIYEEAPVVHPYIVGIGAVVGGTASVSPSWPSGHAAGDVGFLVVATSGNGTDISTPSGWTLVDRKYDVNTTSGVKINLFYKVAASSSESSVATGDSGDHQVAFITAVRGCPTSGDPWSSKTLWSDTSASTLHYISSVSGTANSLLLAFYGLPYFSVTYGSVFAAYNILGIGVDAAKIGGVEVGNMSGISLGAGYFLDATETGEITFEHTYFANSTAAAIVLTIPSSAGGGGSGMFWATNC